MKERADIKRFRKERERLNGITLKYGDTATKRFFNLDEATYKDGALSSKQKEMMGLVASLVLRCDDCIRYHLINCFEKGVTCEELREAANIALIAGGSIVIPHLRRMYGDWEDLSGER